MGNDQTLAKYKKFLKTQLQTIEEQNKEIKKQEEEKQKQLQTIEEQNKEIKKQEEEKQKQLQTIETQQNEIVKHNNENKELKIQNNKLNQNMKAISKENKEIKESLKNIEELNKNLEEQLQKKLDDHNKKVIRELNKKNITISRNEEQIEKLNKELKALQNREKENKSIAEEYQNKIEKIEEEYNKQIEELNIKIENEKNEKKKKEWEEKRRKQNLRYSYNSKINGIKRKKIKLFIENFKQNFCLNDIIIFSKKKTLNLIIDSFKNEKILEFINFFLDNFILDFKKNIKDIEHLNILLVGPTGVGKTTLINSILKVNLKTGIGKPQTQKIESYTSDEIPILRLFDSKGIEKDPSAGIDINFEEITNFIKSQNDPDYYIHCIWYCWTGTRLEEIELKTLKKLSKQYTLEDLPVIIVYTNAIKPSQIEGAKKYLQDMEIKNDFVEVLSLDEKIGFGDKETIIPSYGLDTLIELSLKKAKSAVHSSCYEGLLKEINIEIESRINNLVNKIKDKLEKKIEEIISNFGKTIDRQKLQNEIIKIIVELIYYFFFLSTELTVDPKDYHVNIESFNLNYQITNVTLSKIEEFVVQFFNEFIDIYKKNYNDLIELYKDEIMKEIDKFRMNFIIENGKFEMNSSETIEIETKKFININISEIAEITAFKNFIRNITSPLVEQFSKEFEKLYKIAMVQKGFKDKALKILEISFDKIEQKIKQYNENEKKKKQDAKPNPNEKDESTLILKSGLSDGDLNSIFEDYEEFNK